MFKKLVIKDKMMYNIFNKVCYEFFLNLARRENLTLE